MSSGFTFGAKTTAPPAFGTGSISFGTAPTQQPAPQFGGFGAIQQSTAPSLFTPQAATTSTGLKPIGFGAPTSAPSAGFGLGGPVSSAAANTSFMTPVASAGGTFSGGGLTFGASTTPSLSFGTVSSAPPTLGLNFGATSTSLAPTLNFAPLTTSASLSFGGLGGLTAAPSTIGSLGLGLAPTTQVNLGLGGIATTTQSRAGATASAQKEVPPKEQQLPNEFISLVDQFKNVVHEEKIRSSDVARCSVKEFHKVETELDLLNQHFHQVQNELQNNRNLSEQLKFDTAKGLQNIEMAQRTQDTPPSLQYDNTAPLQFFLDLADNFEREMQLLKQKIDNTEKFVKKCNEPSILTSQDLAMGMKRLHETFVALAGRMQAVHSQVESQKEIFLSLRRQAIKDNVNPFEKMNKHAEAMNTILKNVLKTAPPALASGPTPFNSISLGSNNLTLAAQQTPPPAYPTTTTALGFGTTPMFKPQGFGAPQPFQLNTSSNFQLQKPPTGHKRGKQ